MRLAIAAGDYRLVVAPERGGSILSFTWRGEPVMREAEGPGILDVGCFLMVPFANRIAGGRFDWNGRAMAIPPNFGDEDAYNPIHGYGWLTGWDVLQSGEDWLELGHERHGGEWPWPYRAAVEYVLEADGLTARLSLTNTGEEPMPAGLGFHPYFPRTDATRFIGLHRGEWRGEGNPLPVTLDERDTPFDWWEGRPVSTRVVDTVYSGRQGPLEIIWPERAMAVTITPSANLSRTAVYAPQGSDWFCVEPVSHLTDALNGRDPGAPMPALAPGETLSAEMRLSVRPL
ncbi:aldose 1-epimerase [Novosphingobium sp. NDB2Meth1]|uniref:aldose 1-epimerase n=1 Tax=Novosphingobium sp. NDB2Meth1 TaxID=1892847 RepID=UPI0009314AD9|nr:aldose 1-epimerase [Novosphingobium sp. NDB2Meth1]